MTAINFSDIFNSNATVPSPITTLGDTIYGSAGGTPTRLAGNTFNIKKYLTQTGTGSVSAAPTWEELVLANTTVSPGSYTNANITVGADGRLTAASNGSSAGIQILNSLVAGTQNFAIGTAGSDFGISSSASTHTFNIPSASASARGLLTSTDWSTFNNKVPAARTLTINGTTQDLSIDRTFTISAAPNLPIYEEGILITSTPSSLNFVGNLITGTVVGSDVTLTAAFSLNALTNASQTFATGSAGTDFGISSSAGVHTFNIPSASAANRGLLTAANWTTFNNKLDPSRTLTINGITQDLTANRTYTITATPDLPIYEEGSLLSATPASINFTGRDITATVLSAAVTVTVANIISSLNAQSNNSQTLVTASTGTDFTINSTGGIHTFAIPSASASNRGLLTTADWNTFNSKVPAARALTINGITQDLSIDRTWTISAAPDLTIIDESSTLTTTPVSLAFVGAGVTATNSLNAITVTIPQGLTSLNGLAGTSQTFAVGTSGTDFAISSLGTVHTFNIPSASASNRGLLTSANWTAFNNKQDALSGTGFVKSTAGTISYDTNTYALAGRVLTINGVSQDLSADRTWTIATSGGGGGGTGSCDITWDTIDVADWDALAIGDVCATQVGINVESGGTLIGLADNIRTINFVSGATVADAGAGQIDVTLTGGAGLSVDASRTSNTSNSITLGTKLFTYTGPSSNLIWIVGSRVQALYNSTNYMECVVSATTTTNITLEPYKLVGAGTYTSWTISLAAGGADGAPADMTRSSTDTVAVGTGTRTFTYTVVSNNLGWIVGTRLRASSGVNYVEGVVTAVGSSSVTITSDSSNGTGSFSSWTISIAGEKGSQGPPGTSTVWDLFNYVSFI